jgi:hypothetical protein
MALYNDIKYLVRSSDSTAFDALQNPGALTTHSGIYRCEGCGHEVVSEGGKPLPPQNHHQHPTSQGAIRWRMIVYADHRPK